MEQVIGQAIEAITELEIVLAPLADGVGYVACERLALEGIEKVLEVARDVRERGGVREGPGGLTSDSDGFTIQTSRGA